MIRAHVPTPSLRTVRALWLLCAVAVVGTVVYAFVRAAALGDVVEAERAELARSAAVQEDLRGALADQRTALSEANRRLRNADAPQVPEPATPSGSQPRSRAGVQGPPGPSGDQGPVGRPGLAGKSGARGPAGASVPGPPGRTVTGPAGAAGKDGAAGESGQAGADGKDGATGPAGPPGKDGANGKDGERGPEGSPGKDGAGVSGFTFTVPLEDGGAATVTCSPSGGGDPSPTFVCSTS